MGLRVRQLIATTATTALVIVGLGSIGVPSAAADGTVRYVATTGSDTANTCLVFASPCLTLGHALAQSVIDNTIELSPGTYLVSGNPTGTANAVPSTLHDLTIESNGSAGGTAANTIIDAMGEANGLVVNAGNVNVANLTFRNADREAIRVSPPVDAVSPSTVSNFTLTGATITNNDRCSAHPSGSNCLPQESALLPFGWGVVLSSVVDATVTGNTVTGNWGGIELDDAMGPAHANTISGNTASNNGAASGPAGSNLDAAGIFVEGESPGGVSNAVTHPSLGGVFGNTISGNTVNGNGAAGIVLTAFAIQDAVYANTVSGNTANDNGGPGIAIKSLFGQEDLNGNVVTGNHVSHDALHEGPNNGPGDIDAGLMFTTGILVFSATAPLTGTVVTGNTVSDVYYGVWMSLHTTKANVSSNTTTFDAGGAAIHVQRFAAPMVGIVHTPTSHGYWQVESDGSVFPFGDAGYYGSLGGEPLNSLLVGMAATPSGHGYWLVASDGGVFSFGDAGFYGSTGAIHLNRSIVGIAAGPSGLGYWLVAADGGIFSFGSAKFHGSTGAIHLNQPIVGMAAGPSGLGYWLVAADGGIFSFGSAKFHGSTGAIHLNQPIVGMAAGPSALGYWLVASDTGIFSFGSAKFHGSLVGGDIHLQTPMVGMTGNTTGLGYWLTATGGGVFSFGDARYYGAESANPTG